MKSDLGHGSRAESSLPIAAGLAPEIENVDDEGELPEGDAVRAPRDYEMLGRRTLFISALSLAIGAVGAIVAAHAPRLSAAHDAKITAKWR